MTRKLLIALILWPSILFAQQHTTVEPERIVLNNGEYMPRFAALMENTLVVPAGQTRRLDPGVYTFDAIEVAGTLEQPAGVTIRTVHAYVLPGGKWVGAGCAQPSSVVILDRPIITTGAAADPFQFGNGFVNFGRREFTGCPMAKTWELLTQDVAAGATTLALPVPAGWMPGDELVIPDTAQAQQPDWTTRLNPPRRDALRIASIAADRQSLTLEAPVGFERKAVRDMITGEIVARIPVANRTRRGFTVTSENPRGVAGHIADVGHESSFKSEYVGYIGLGRTTNKALNSTPVDVSSVGTNQAGRYDGHCHHCDGSKSTSTGDLFAAGGAPGKAGFALHGASDLVMQQAVIVDFTGAGFVTEDGNETRWTFRDSFIAYIDPGNEPTLPGQAGSFVAQRPFGEGSGVWLRGHRGATMTGLQVWNTRIGLALMNSFAARNVLKYPSTPGGAFDTTHNPGDANNLWKEFARLTFGANRTQDIDFWSYHPQPLDDVISVNSFGLRISSGPSVGNIWLRRLTVIGTGGECIHSPKPYIETFQLHGAKLQGCATALGGGLGRVDIDVRDVAIHDVTYAGVDWTPQLPDGAASLRNVTFTTSAGKTAAPWLRYGIDDPIWQPGQPIPGGMSGPHNGCQHRAINWNGSGTDYCFYEPRQNRSNPAWQGTTDQEIGSPEPGLTLGQLWDRYGIGWRGGVYDPAKVVQAPGVVGGVATLMVDAAPLGPRRFIVTTPKNGQVLTDTTGANQFWMFGAFVGNQVLQPAPSDGLFNVSRNSVRVQIDNAQPYTIPGIYMGQLGRREMGYFRYPGVTPKTTGTHIVRTWRLDEAGNVIPNSEATTEYVIGAPTPQQPVNCTVGAWSDPAWTLSSESATALTLTRTRTRVVVTPAANGGTCTDPLGETQTRTVTLDQPATLGPVTGTVTITIDGQPTVVELTQKP